MLNNLSLKGWIAFDRVSVNFCHCKSGFSKRYMQLLLVIGLSTKSHFLNNERLLMYNEVHCFDQPNIGYGIPSINLAIAHGMSTLIY